MICLLQPAWIICMATNFCYQVAVWSSWSARVVSGLPLPLPTMFGAPKVTLLQDFEPKPFSANSKVTVIIKLQYIEHKTWWSNTVPSFASSANPQGGKKSCCIIIKVSLRSSKANKYYWMHLINTSTNFGSCFNLSIPSDSSCRI